LTKQVISLQQHYQYTVPTTSFSAPSVETAVLDWKRAPCPTFSEQNMQELFGRTGVGRGTVSFGGRTPRVRLLKKFCCCGF